MLLSFTLRLRAGLRLGVVAAALLLAHAGQASSHEPQSKATAAAKPARVAARPVTASVAAPLPATEAAAPHTTVLKGVVLKADGQPCPGAGVYPAGAPRQVVVTDATGAFALVVPAATPLAVQADYFGLGSSRVVVQNPAEQPLRIVIGH